MCFFAAPLEASPAKITCTAPHAPAPTTYFTLFICIQSHDWEKPAFPSEFRFLSMKRFSHESLSSVKCYMVAFPFSLELGLKGLLWQKQDSHRHEVTTPAQLALMYVSGAHTPAGPKNCFYHQSEHQILIHFIADKFYFEITCMFPV